MPNLAREAPWYKSAIIYQMHVRSFADSKQDGIGDFAGLTSRLDYIQDLGVTALWLLPFYPSPLKDDGYDIADYCDVNPIYGDLAEFKTFLKEAHARGLRVITELVLNHTSDQHAWFQRARQASKGSKAREFYVWSDTPERYREARVIFKDFETSNWAWDEVAQAYYWHRFYSHQPDLNFDNPDVHKALRQTVDFWFKLGVDGLRLDAVPYLYERDGTSCENLPETHQFLKTLRTHVDGRFTDRMLLAEANQWPEDAVAYYGEGDECHMAFHFPLMPRLFMAVQQEDRFPILDILQQTPAIPDACQWTIFLRNHDELTLEMVTDEERDYMYRVYARDPQARINLGIRRRLAPLLGNNRRKIELMNALLFSLPGTPVIYYGDELGMGDNIYLGDRDSVRTPMQWSADRNAGFSRATPQKLFLPVVTDPEFHFSAINVESQQNSPHSLLWWMKRLIMLRKRYQALSCGTIEFLHPENPKVLAFVRRAGNESVLVVANLSRFVQCAELELSAFKGATPIEVFGHSRLPSIGERPYCVTLGPHAFYWFLLEGKSAASPETEAKLVPSCRVASFWTEALVGPAQSSLEAALPNFLMTRRWFAGKARVIQAVDILDVMEISSKHEDSALRLVVIKVLYGDDAPECYLLPLAFASEQHADQIHEDSVTSILVKIAGNSPAECGVIYDASRERACWNGLFELIARKRRTRSDRGEVFGWHNRNFSRLRGASGTALIPNVLRTEQSNSTAIIGDQFVLKLFRKIDEGENPELEISRLLTEGARFPHSPALVGAIEYQTATGQQLTMGTLHEYLPDSQQAWEFTLNELGRYFERVGSEFTAIDTFAELPAETRWSDLLDREPSPRAREIIGPFLHLTALLGQRTAEMHLALASASSDSAFLPEPFTPHYQRGLFQSMRNHGRRVLSLLKRRVLTLPEEMQGDARTILGLENEIVGRFRRILERKITALRIRCHGDYHLGQVLYTGKDFAIIDFEGEPMRPISERRIKRSPLRDVASMIRSFHYASQAGLLGQVPGVAVRSQDLATYRPWAWFWFLWTSAVFVKAYLSRAGAAPFLPQDQEEIACLLDTYLLEKSLYELSYELNHRPDWIAIPMCGVLDVLQATHGNISPDANPVVAGPTEKVDAMTK